MGALMAPLSFLIIWEMTFSLPASIFAGLLILLGKFAPVKFLISYSYIITSFRSWSVDVDSIHFTGCRLALFHLFDFLRRRQVPQSTQPVISMIRVCQTFICFYFRGYCEFSCIRPFSVVWWFWLLMSGLLLALTITQKYLGVMTITLIGLRTIEDLWIILGDISRPVVILVEMYGE